MVERSLSMREVPGSIPGASKYFFTCIVEDWEIKIFASSGNRTRAARVAGEHSTTEPTMLAMLNSWRSPTRLKMFCPRKHMSTKFIAIARLAVVPCQEILMLLLTSTT